MTPLANEVLHVLRMRPVSHLNLNDQRQPDEHEVAALAKQLDVSPAQVVEAVRELVEAHCLKLSTVNFGDASIARLWVLEPIPFCDEGAALVERIGYIVEGALQVVRQTLDECNVTAKHHGNQLGPHRQRIENVVIPSLRDALRSVQRAAGVQVDE